VRRLLAPLVAAVLAAALAGCVGMPTDGPVVSTRDRTNPISAEGAPFIRPLPPQDGDSRTQIVRGFINAMQAWPSDLSTAKQYLTGDASAAWSPHDETVTYPAPPSPVDNGAQVDVTLVGANRLDSRGAWQGALPPDHRTITFPMVLEGGEWRINQAPNALLVPESWFGDRYRQVSVYFFDPTGSILAPEPVFVPRGEQLATSLTEALLMGPGPGLERVEQTFIPPDLDVAVGVTVSNDGVADVLLNGDAGQLSAETVQLMMAQFAWTLRQEPTVHSVRLSIGGELVPLPGGVGSYRVDGGIEYDPAGFQASPLLFGLSGGRVVSGTAGALEPVDGPMGHRSYGLRSVGVSVRAEIAAGVADGGASVLTAPLSDIGRAWVRTPATGTDFLRPAWDFADRMWLVDRTRNGARVYYVEGRGTGSAVRLRVPGISGTRVRMFLVSRDGTRLLAVLRRPAGDVLMVSRIEHTANGKVSGALPAERISAGENSDLPILDLAWRTSASVALLNPLTPTLAEVAPASVDGAPVNPDVAATAVDGRVLALAGSPAPEEPIYGVRRRGVFNVESSDHRPIPFEAPTTAVVYAG
jgi:hypothetical protein